MPKERNRQKKAKKENMFFKYLNSLNTTLIIVKTKVKIGNTKGIIRKAVSIGFLVA
ncbi:MAG: hypothetical protein ACI8ZN_000281 [Bacteroidia bacterium]|jgi:hypothetical protein